MIRSNNGVMLSIGEVSKKISIQRTDDELSPLHIAAIFGHADAVRSLLVCIYIHKYLCIIFIVTYDIKCI